jgi:cytochrome P450
MADFFEPVSVLGLGRVLGLGHLPGDTLRRWFHGLAQGAINFEDDPARWAVSDATGAEIDEELAPLLERLWAEPDGSTIATMLQHAEGSFEERVARILPTLKVILLGGMQEPGHAAGSTLVGLLESGQAAALAADPAGLVRDAVEEGLRWLSPIGTQTRRCVVDLQLGGVALPAGASLGLLVSSANRDEDVWGPTADRFDMFRTRRNHAAFGFGPHFCSGHHFSRVQMRIALQRLFERLPGLRLDPERPPVLSGWEFRAPRSLHVRWDAP